MIRMDRDGLRIIESVLEQNRHLPKYYPTMYLDGYTPEEIMRAVRLSMIEEFLKRQDDAENKREEG